MKAEVDQMRVTVGGARNITLQIKTAKGKLFEFVMGGQAAAHLADRFAEIANKLPGFRAFNTTASPRTNLDLEAAQPDHLKAYDPSKPGFQLGVSEDRQFVTLRFSGPPEADYQGVNLDLALPAQDVGVLLAGLQEAYSKLDPRFAPPLH
ncbi:hypothetical protein ACP4J4_10425 [Aureimonas ureilytica]|uniref:hypothetical protein n=1 Tax=Aureimonas ureilytica TaxID=401562 RepID=UPI003CF01A03